MRLTWQAVTICLGAMAASVAALRARNEHEAIRGRIAWTIHALDLGGHLRGDQVVQVLDAGDAEPGSYPEGED